ncbi:hypothetical protein [Clavibacter michiganensis]|uniref:hypothetical protein n=1 Tax=Clavibacter michiganensis TaxID=28447 RepID=UPI0013656467|nr:hypothetical protein [Clavibacter michiganensis]
MTQQVSNQQTESTVLEAISSARASGRDSDVIYGVKKAVADELVRLDGGLKITTTDYFNHSYIPDLVATWREDGRKQERPVFIRGSFSTMVASEDATALSDQDPLLISVGQESGDVLKKLRAQLPKATKTLATEASTTARIGSASNLAVGESQLSGLVRTNIVRGARGLLTADDAKRIAAVESTDAAHSLRVFQRVVRKLFTGATAERLGRTASILEIFFDQDPNLALLDQLRDDPLSDGELRIVLPYVLQRASEVKAEAVWQALASMLTLERIETLAPALADLDLTELIRPALSGMIAARSAVFASAQDLSDEEKDAAEPLWRVQNGKLMADVHRWSLWLGSDARKLRARDDGPDARWDEISEPLRVFELEAIDLHGLSRQLSVSNPEAGAVRDDVELFRRTIQDDFHVASVTIRDKGSEPSSNSSVTISFGEGTATGKAPVDFHVRAAALLAVKRPFTGADLDKLLGA